MWGNGPDGARVFANRFEVKSAIRDVSLRTESPARLAARDDNRPHNAAAVSPPPGHSSHLTCSRYRTARRRWGGRWESVAGSGCGSFRPSEVIMGFFHTSIKLATALETLRLPGEGFKIKDPVRRSGVRRNVSIAKKRRRRVRV